MTNVVPTMKEGKSVQAWLAQIYVILKIIIGVCLM